MDSGGVGKAVGTEVSGHVLVLVPSSPSLDLVRGGFCSVCRDWACGGAIEVAPLLVGLHGLLEAHGEDRPVGAVGFKMGNRGREGV